MPDPTVVDDEVGPAWLAGYAPKWYLWRSGRDHYYRHEAGDSYVRVVLWSGESFPADDDGTFRPPRHSFTNEFGVHLTSECYKRSYRVFMKRGERLRISLGGRPTRVPVQGVALDWDSAGRVSHWENSELTAGGFPDGGNGVDHDWTTWGVGTTGAIYYDDGAGHCLVRWSPAPNLGPREVSWAGNGGGGSTRVYLTEQGHSEQLIIVEPGSGAGFVALGASTLPAAHFLFHAPDAFAVPCAGTSLPSNAWDNPVGYPEEGLLADSDNGVGSNPNDMKVNSPMAAEEFHDLVAAGDPLPSPPASDVVPRVPRDLLTLTLDDWIGNPIYGSGSGGPYTLQDNYTDGSTAWEFDHRRGGTGDVARGADAMASAYGTRMAGGGGWGGGGGGNAHGIRSVYLVDQGTVGTSHIAPAGFLRLVDLGQQVGRAGGRWWNDRRVEHMADENVEPLDTDQNLTDPIWPPHRYGVPINTGGNSGPYPYGVEPWKLGMGAAWICPEEPVRKFGWHLGKLGSLGPWT